MVSSPDKILLEIADRFSYKTDPQGAEPWADIRRKNREIRQTLFGKYADVVALSDTDQGRQFSPNRLKDGPTRVIIYVHGGGWCNCDLVTHASIMTDLAAVTGHEVFGVNYPLAPENPYPAALDVICAMVEAVYRQSQCEIILAGDSAGANLALATALRLRDEQSSIPISALLLWYGCYRRMFETRSHLAFGDGSCGLTTDAMKQFWDHYVPEHIDPVYADLSGFDMSGLPPCYLCEAECDCLTDDTRWLAGKLMEAGVPHFHDTYKGAVHGFLHFSGHYAPSLRTLEMAAGFLDVALPQEV